VSSPPALSRATAAFKSAFGANPTHSASAPGRINLIGEHTDYNGGLVLPMPIDLHCVAVASPARGANTRLLAADLGEEFSFDSTGDLSRHLDGPGGTPRGHWPSYILGVLDGFRQRGHKLASLNIAIASDIPVGAGLSSSAALEAATALLVESILAWPFDRLELARLCRQAEHTFAGVPCGIMDQYAVLLGRPGHALFIDCAKETSELVPLPRPDKAAILIIDTQVRHKLGATEYAHRRDVCAAAAAKLGAPNVSAIGFSGLSVAQGLTEEESRLAFYVLTENARVVFARMALADGNLEFAGKLMFESHEDLRRDYRVSCPELDTIVDTARTIPGVYGARMTGAGFGGSAITLLQPESVERARTQIGARFNERFGRECRFFALNKPA
jgi:galactokinase